MSKSPRQALPAQPVVLDAESDRGGREGHGRVDPADTDLRRRRRALGRSLQGVAGEIGVHPNSLGRWERRERLPGPLHVMALARELDLSVRAVSDFFHPPSGLRPAAQPVVPDRVRVPGLRRVRRRQGTTAAQIADMFDVPPATVYNWEAGRVRMPATHVSALARHWRVDADALQACLRIAAVDDPPAPITALRRMRLVAGLSQTEVAARLGVARSSVGHWEKGQPPPLYAVRAIARLYGRTCAEVAHAASVPPRRELDPRNWQPGDLAHAISALRAWSGLTQRDLAARCGVSRDCVRSWEHARTVPGSRARSRLEALFNLTENALLRAYPAPAQLSKGSNARP